MDKPQAKRPAPRRERPGIKDYGIETGPEGMMDWSWADAQLTKSHNYWIASTRADGRPHVAPVWGVWIDGALYFGSERSAIKARNLAARPDVIVHLESGDDVVIAEGRAVEVKEAATMATVGPAFVAKYDVAAPELGSKAVWFVVAPHSVLGWVEKDFPKTATRWVFEDGRR